MGHHCDVMKGSLGSIKGFYKVYEASCYTVDWVMEDIGMERAYGRRILCESVCRGTGGISCERASQHFLRKTTGKVAG